jgi:hypothetical protein
MPWTKTEAKKHNKKAVGKKASEWSATANVAIKKGKTK